MISLFGFQGEGTEVLCFQFLAEFGASEGYDRRRDRGADQRGEETDKNKQKTCRK